MIGSETILATIGKRQIVRGSEFTHNSDISRFNRAIKGLTFTIRPGDIDTARYGAGTGLRRSRGMHGFVVHNITISKNDLKRRGYDIDRNKSLWGQYGVSESGTPGYINVQVITDVSGSQAALNIKSDKEWGGSAYSKSRIARNQAMQEERAAME